MKLAFLSALLVIATAWAPLACADTIIDDGPSIIILSEDPPIRFEGTFENLSMESVPTPAPAVPHSFAFEAYGVTFVFTTENAYDEATFRSDPIAQISQLMEARGLHVEEAKRDSVCGRSGWSVTGKTADARWPGAYHYTVWFLEPGALWSIALVASAQPPNENKGAMALLNGLQ